VIVTAPADAWNGLLRPEVELDEPFWDEFSARLRAAKLVFGGRVHCPFLRPFFLSRADVARLSQVAEALAAIGELLPEGTFLLSGALRRERVADGASAAPSSDRPRAYNSLMVFGDSGDLAAVYDKIHLVPFGEYLPFQGFMERLGFVQLTKVHGGFIPGQRRRAMEIPNAPSALPLICYEAIFPGIIGSGDDRPGWIINVTNDGWFGNSTGPYQHLQQARLRAIEEGLPVVRAANTGISAVIDPSGRIVARLGLGIEGVLDASLPAAIAPTIYARVGDIPAAITIAAALLFVIRRRFVKRPT
jgi:apolipoprotein N-acyltransferase